MKVTERRTAEDFAHCMGDLVDVHYPEAACIRVVLDNLSTHTPAALYRTLPAGEARRIRRRLEFHYTPRHASWLNMVEIEIGVLRGHASTAASKAAAASLPRSKPGNADATQAALASNGCSLPSKLASNSPKPIQTQPPKSHNLCAVVLSSRPIRLRQTNRTKRDQ